MINLFFSYSHTDESLRDELDKHLSILKRSGIINGWHDRRINAGTELNKEISSNLKSADIILLLVSSDFLASDYCFNNEMKYAMEMHERKEAVVIPVILRPCDWQDAPFGKLMAVPTDGKPVIKFASLDEAFLNITTQLKAVIAKLPEKQTHEVKYPVVSEISANENIYRPRSSNLRITKVFTDHEKDKFLDEAFDYMANYFEGSLTELKTRNPEIDYRYKRVDSQTFTASVYVNGKTKSECMVFFGGGFNKGISYSTQISASHNSFNESFTVEDDGYNLYLKTYGMFYGNRKESCSFEGASEYYWERFIQPLQN